jgi:lysophospholipase L1-like esterase
MRVLIFGDGITQGFWDLEYGGWVQRIRKTYDQQSIKNLAGEKTDTFNLGVDGDTTTAIVKRLSYEIEARRWQDDPFVLVFQVGLNDTQFAGEEVMSTPEQYGDELDVLISSAQHYSDHVLFVGLTPVDDELCNPWLHSQAGVSFKNERIREFDGTLRKICLEKNISCVQVFEKFQEEQGKRNLLADGLHPNNDGHQLIADLVKPHLDKLL